MLEWLKSAWANSKVRVTMVGGVIVIATAYGTCSVDPQEVSEAPTGSEVEVSDETNTETVPVSETSTTTETTTTTGNVETSGDTTTETNATE